MKNLRVAILVLAAMFIGAALVIATEPKLKLPPELKNDRLDLGYYAKSFQGFDGLEQEELKPTGRMVQVCENGVCKMVPEMALESVQAVTSDICQDCGKAHTAASSASNGLLYTAKGRQRLFQPLRRWRLRFSSGRWFPNAWWNK